MARSFTQNEAIAIGKWHSNLLSRLKHLASLPADPYVSEISRTLTELTADGYFKRSFLKEVRDGVDPLKDRDPLSHLVTSIYRYRSFLNLTQTCTSVLETSGSEVERLLADIEPAYKGFTWNFLPSRTKIAAENAYLRLSEMRESNLCKTAKEELDTYDSLHHVSPDEAWSDFQSNRIGYRNALSKFVEGTFSDAEIEDETLILLKEADEIAAVTSSLREVSNEKISTIKSAAKETIKARAIFILDESPIEDLVRKNPKIKPQVLKSLGYNTIGALRGISTHELVAKTGLGWKAADEVIDTVQEFEALAKKSARIRLSLDSKTTESTRLITEIFGLLKLRDLSSEIERYDPQIEKNLTENVAAMRRYSDTRIWPFRDEEYRLAAVNEYRDLRSKLDSDYSRLARQVDTDIKAIRDAHGLFSAETERAWMAFEEEPIRFLNVLEEIVPNLLGRDIDFLSGLPKQIVEDISKETPLTVGLKCKLRRYQEWGVKYILHQGNALLGDEMGLGKTIEAIASMVALKNAGASHFLVICPAGVLPNWCKEIAKHSELSAVKVHGQDKLWDFATWMNKGDVAVTTYETSATLDFPDTLQIDMLVVDEAHYVKNSESRRSRSVAALCKISSRILFMTGTALENDVNEMLTLISFLNPKVAEDASQYALFTSAEAFKDSVAPVYYRRKREDVLSELPELTEIEAWCSLSEEEMRDYDYFVLKRDRTSMRRVSWITNEVKRSSKMKRLKEIIKDAKDDNRRILVFSFFLDTIWDIYKELGDMAVYPITGAIPPKQRQEIIDEFNDAPPGKVLIAQITAGGTGINIQSASVVVICEPQYKPSIENQAISRAYRMGQSRDVLVYRLLAEDTLDESITALLQQKQLEFDTFADKSIAGLESIHIDDRDVGNLIEEEIERIKRKYGISGEPDEKMFSSFIQDRPSVSSKERAIPEYKSSRTPGSERTPEVKRRKSSAAKQFGQIERAPQIKTRKKKVRDKKKRYDFNVAGVNKQKTGPDWESAEASQVSVVREKKNRYDKNAIALHIGGWKAGYVPRQLAANMATFLDAGYTAEVSYISTEEVPEKKRYKDEFGDYYYEEDYSKTFYVVSMGIVLDEPGTAERAVEEEKKQAKKELEEIEQKRIHDLTKPLNKEEAKKLMTMLPESLTQRQAEAFALISQGKTRAEASFAMGIKEGSFGDYTKAIYSKFGFHSKKELIEYARQLISDTKA